MSTYRVAGSIEINGKRLISYSRIIICTKPMSAEEIKVPNGCKHQSVLARHEYGFSSRSVGSPEESFVNILGEQNKRSASESGLSRE